MRKIRQLHFYLGVFFAPSILFFALTGALQTFGLHEKSNTPALVAELAQIHKNQTVSSRREGRPEGRAEGKPEGAPLRRANGAERERGAGERGTGEGGAPPRERGEGAFGAEARGPSPLPLKVFTVLMSLGLATTTLLGVSIALQNKREKRLTWILLAAGTLLPVALLYL